jgi:hypothetical protein
MPSDLSQKRPMKRRGSVENKGIQGKSAITERDNT